MINKSVNNIDLPEEVWKIIDNEFKLNKESDAEVLCNIIRNHLAEHGFHANIHSLAHGHGIKDYLDMQETMIMSVLELLESKGLATYQEWVNIMDKKVMKE